MVYVVWSKIILTELIPYICILICNGLIIYKITKSAKLLRSFNEGEASPAYGARGHRDGEAADLRGVDFEEAADSILAANQRAEDTNGSVRRHLPATRSSSKR